MLFIVGALALGIMGQQGGSGSLMTGTATPVAPARPVEQAPAIEQPAPQQPTVEQSATESPAALEQ